MLASLAGSACFGQLQWLVLHLSATDSVINLFAQVELAVVNALRCHHCPFYGDEDVFGLDSRLMTHDRVSMYLPSAVVAKTEDIGQLNIVRETQLDAATSVVAFKRLRDFNWSAMGFASATGWLRYRHADGTVLAGVSCPRRELTRRHRQLMSLPQAKCSAFELLNLVYGVPTSMSFYDHPL